MDLNTAKIGRLKLGVQQRLEKPELERRKLSVQFVDKERGVIVAADENYEQFELPLKLAAGAETLLEPGTALGVTLDGETPVKIALPSNILNMVKKL